MINALTCNGDLTVSVEGVPFCAGTWELVPMPEHFDIQQLDPMTLGAFFGVGFSLVATVLIGSLGAKAVLDFIKRA
ncbi:hypothetical protein [Thiopseudomonas alkaliphila]|uniref:hypothetical protein n=1 Tax=Thiopseudomonas alkaliphila TaxID=1697053 RepID=UPI0025751215|nr:hypothetical protein [Thiopseudomonas alkaliphila]MDM1708913.1 hypothetical protein [Thiopseudomonas alkaliphila]